MGLSGWGQCFVYVQYMGHTVSNVLVKYVREVAILVLYMSNTMAYIYEPYFVRGPSNILTIHN